MQEWPYDMGYNRRIWILILTVLLLSAGMAVRAHTVQERVRQYGPAVHARLCGYFRQQGVAYPPRKLTIIALKDQQKLWLYAPNAAGAMRPIRCYDILAASGTLGPKLREGDDQVPEGSYRIAELNPDSSYHLSLGLNYPNAFDREMARRNGRSHLGGDIMIHGNAVSAGCLAMGDTVAEELFVLAAETGINRITVIVSPVDFRLTNCPVTTPPWVALLYAQLKQQLAAYPLPPTAPPNIPHTPRVRQAAAPPPSHLWIYAGGLVVVCGLLLVILGRMDGERRRRRRARREKLI